MSDVQMTHSTDCWKWHHECAKRAVEELAIDKERLRAENERLARAKAIVDEQAEDEGLWFCAKTAAEAYLQQELRRLHAAVEGERDALRAENERLRAENERIRAELCVLDRREGNE